MSDPTEPQTWRARDMQGGRWRDPKAKEPVPRADKTISVRLTEAELAELDGQIASLGLTRNRALRIAARRIGGFLETDAETAAMLQDISRQMRGIATNVNQIAKAGNQSRHPDFRAFLEERQALGKELARVSAMLQEILEVARRREDGLARLSEASA